MTGNDVMICLFVYLSSPFLPFFFSQLSGELKKTAEKDLRAA